MAEVKDAIFYALIVVIWTPFLIFIAAEIRREYRDRRDCRRLARRLKADAEAYRDLDLIHPIGRDRLGIPTDRRNR